MATGDLRRSGAHTLRHEALQVRLDSAVIRGALLNWGARERAQPLTHDNEFLVNL